MRSPTWFDDAVAVTGMGAVSAHGSGCAVLRDAVSAGRSGIRPVTRFSTDGFSTRLGAEVPGRKDPGLASNPGTVGALFRAFAREALREAMGDAGLDRLAPLSGGRSALLLGTGLGEVGCCLHEVTEELARELEITGPVLTLSTACSSSTNALGWGYLLLRSGAADLVLAGGVDVLTPEVFAGFHALGVLGGQACAPFSLPVGTTLSEGAGFMVLERAPGAEGRGQAIHAFLTGYGSSGDAFHETSPEPGGRGVARALTISLESGGHSPQEIDYVNAHGSGTPANDQSEWRGIRTAMGERADHIPVSSTKGSLGHAQGAAGVLEAIVTVQTMQQGVVPPSLNFSGPRPYCPEDPVGQVKPRVHRVDHAATLNSAFGGANAALIIARSRPAERPQLRKRVFVLGTGAVSSRGPGPVDGERDLSLAGRVPDFSLKDFLPRADPRGLDPLSRYLAVAASLALAQGEVIIKGSLREAAGLIVGCREVSPESLEEFHRSIVERGLTRLSATAFARIVMNAPAGFCSKLLALRGPQLTLSAGADSGLAAILAGATVLSDSPGVRLMLAAGMEELGSGAGAERGEGAGCVVLADSPRGQGVPIEVAGWSLRSPGQGRQAVADVLTGSASPAAGGSAIFCDSTLENLDELVFSWDQGARVVDYGPWARQAPAAGSVWALAEAVRAMRAGEIGHSVIVASSGGSCTPAIHLTVAEME